MQDPKRYMIATKFNVDKKDNQEIWHYDEHIQICNEIEEGLKLRHKGNWNRIKHVFYFDHIDDAMRIKLHYYDYVKYAKILEE